MVMVRIMASIKANISTRNTQRSRFSKKPIFLFLGCILLVEMEISFDSVEVAGRAVHSKPLLPSTGSSNMIDLQISHQQSVALIICITFFSDFNWPPTSTKIFCMNCCCTIYALYALQHPAMHCMWVHLSTRMGHSVKWFAYQEGVCHIGGCGSPRLHLLPSIIIRISTYPGGC